MDVRFGCKGYFCIILQNTGCMSGLLCGHLFLAGRIKIVYDYGKRKDAGRNAL